MMRSLTRLQVVFGFGLMILFLLIGALPLFAQQNDQGTTYTIQSGDTPLSVAIQFHITAICLSDANNLPSLAAFPANLKEVTIPKDCSLVGAGSDVTTPTPEALTTGASEATSEATAAVTPSGTPTSSGLLTDQTYVVKAGDRLSKIADSFGVTVNCIVQANRIANADLIYVGQQLLITASCQGGGGGSAAGETVSTSGTGTTRAACQFDRNPGRVAADGKYTVQAGDSLDFIACDFGISLQCLKAANSQLGNMLAIGDTITIDLSCPAWTPWPGAGTTSGS